MNERKAREENRDIAELKAIITNRNPLIQNPLNHSKTAKMEKTVPNLKFAIVFCVFWVATPLYLINHAPACLKKL